METAFNVAEFEAMARIATGLQPASNGDEIQRANESMESFKQDPTSYGKVPIIISQSSCPAARFLALGVLETAVVLRWNGFPEEERQHMRSFVQSFVGHLASTVDQHPKYLVAKTNSVLVQIAKREWPHRWPTFVQEVVTGAPTSPAICRNNLAILRTLSEELFEFEEKKMTRRWIERRREALKEDFGSIFNLCSQVLSSQNLELQCEALLTLEKCIPWMGSDAILQQPLFAALGEFAWVKETQLASLRCLREIASMKLESNRLGPLMLHCLQRTVQLFNEQTDPSVSQRLESRILRLFNSNQQDERPILEAAAQFYCALFKNHPALLEHPDSSVINAHRVILGVTAADVSEFKDSVAICVEYWRWFAELLVIGAVGSLKPAQRSMLDKIMDCQVPTKDKLGSSKKTNRRSFSLEDPPPLAQNTSGLRTKFHPIMESLRRALIQAMIKPEEVLLVEDENGQLVQQYVTDLEAQMQFQLMRQLLIFVTMTEPAPMVATVRSMIQRQIDGTDYSWSNLNRVCWSTGALSGSMTSTMEDDFFVSVLRDMLDFCAKKKGKEHKAVIATNIMYIAGQYPRFLMKHNRFFRTVCRKLFDFMKEPYPGIKDMAVDTFLKLTRLIPDAFVTNTPSKFAFDVVEQLAFVTCDLSQTQVHIFYEAMGICVNAMEELAERAALLGALCRDPAAGLEAAASRAESNPSGVVAIEEMRGLLHILKTFTAIAKTCGPAFLDVMSTIFFQLQRFYAAYSANIVSELQAQGEQIAGHMHVRLMKSIKKEFLRLTENFVAATDQPSYVATSCWPVLLGPVLDDYHNLPPVVKDANVLSLLTTCVEKLQGHLAHETKTILEKTFECTKAMIASNFHDFPDHRLYLFKLLGALNAYCFEAVLEYATQNPDIIHGMLWAAKHEEPSVMTAGLITLHGFLSQVVHSGMAGQFFAAFYYVIFLAILEVMTDTAHTQGFPQHCNILSLLFHVSALNESVQDCNFAPQPVTQWVTETLQKAFPSLQPTQIAKYTTDCFQLRTRNLEFALIQGDFLIECQVWGAEMENQLDAASSTGAAGDLRSLAGVEASFQTLLAGPNQHHPAAQFLEEE